jgi:hypothetical protein
VSQVKYEAVKSIVVNCSCGSSALVPVLCPGAASTEEGRGRDGSDFFGPEREVKERRETRREEKKNWLRR